MTDDLSATLVEEIRGLRTDVRAALSATETEREGRRQSQALATRSQRLLRAAVVMLFIVGALWIVDLRRDGQQSCSTRTASRVEIRAAVVAVVDEVARFAEVTGDGRDDLLDRAALRLREELPPPDC